MAKKIAAVIIALGLAGQAGAEMMGTHMRGMGPGPAAELIGPDLRMACAADLSELALSPELKKSLEDKRFEGRKKFIRAMADLQVLRLELARMLEQRNFDLTAAQKKVGEISTKEAELRTAHVDVLYSFASALTDEQWQKLQEAKRRGPPGPMGMMGGGGMPCMAQGGGPVPGAMAPCGMMHDGHRTGPPSTSKEAEEFFRKQ